METITIFTPAYNRAHTLVRTYESLLRQDCRDFKWLIVDDGSSDNTRELVEEWKKKENGFEIQYIYKENGGMHTAHNVAYENIDTELNVCIDSDDMLGENAISKILEKWEQVKDKGYAGIIGLDADFSGEIIGKGFPSELKETTLVGYYANGGSGDKKLVYRTDIINKYPPYPILSSGLLKIALLACNQFSLASPTGSPVSLNTSGKKYGKNLPSVYLTPGISAIILIVVPLPTEPTTASNPMLGKYFP